MFDFSQKVVLVSGAGGNLGSASARSFLAAGARLVLVDLAEDRLVQLFPELAGSPDHILANSVDVSQPEAVQNVIAETVARFGRIDVLANCIGGYRGGTSVHETPLETWEFLHNLNARNLFIICQAVIPAMLAQQSGKIINVAARSALAGGARLAAYSASKAAVVRLTESLAAELKNAGINANCVLPGTIDTPQNRQATPNADPTRWVSPDAIADVILFLASPAARAIHGAAIPVYGLS